MISSAYIKSKSEKIIEEFDVLEELALYKALGC